MRTVRTGSKAAQLLSYTAASVFVLAGCSSSDDSTPVTTTTPVGDITVSGVMTDINGVPLTGVTVQGVYTSSSAVNPSTLTDTGGGFSLTLEANTAFHLNGTFLGYATLNSEILDTSVNITGLDIDMPRSPEVEAFIDAAFPTDQLAIVNHAWLAVDIVDENGNDVSGETIALSVPPSDFVYRDCDGTPSGGNTTIACLDRAGPMYIAYFDAAAESTASTVDQTKTAPLRIDQVTALEYAIGPDYVTAFDRGAAYYDAYCADCHSAGSYDPEGFTYNLIGRLVIQELSLYQGMEDVADLTPEQQADLHAFFLDPSLL